MEATWDPGIYIIGQEPSETDPFTDIQPDKTTSHVSKPSSSKIVDPDSVHPSADVDDEEGEEVTRTLRHAAFVRKALTRADGKRTDIYYYEVG